MPSASYGLAVTFDSQAKIAENDYISIRGENEHGLTYYYDEMDELAGATIIMPESSYVEITLGGKHYLYHSDASESDPYGYKVASVDPLNQNDIRRCSVEVEDVVYSGTARVPYVWVENSEGGSLVKDVDYSVQVFDNVNIGTARAVITGTGKYAGSSVTREYQIRGAHDLSVAYVETDPYTCFASDVSYMPTVSVWLNGLEVPASGYTV